MKSTRICIALLFLGSVLRTEAQQYFTTDLYLSAGINTYHNKTFNKFAESFNQYNGSAVKKPLSTFGPGLIRDYGLTFKFHDDVSVIDFGFFISTANSRAQATYTSNEKRIMDMRRQFFGFEMGAGPEWEKSSLVFTFGALFGNTIIDSYYIYPDGTKSHGQEKYWNGIFDAFNVAGFLSAKYSKYINDWRLMTRLSFGGDLFKKFYLQDHNMARGLNVVDQRPERLPMNVADYMADPYHYKGDDVQNLFRCIGLQIGLAYSLHGDN